MGQTYTSANTSINKGKLPAVYSKVDFSAFHKVLDYGCGKYNNAKDFIEGMGKEWYGYDKYNRTADENIKFVTNAFEDNTCCICSNVLNVIDSEEEIAKIAHIVTTAATVFFVTVYEGNKSGRGCVSMWDCYQRNERAKDYLRFFPETAVVRKGVITNAPELLK